MTVKVKDKNIDKKVSGWELARRAALRDIAQGQEHIRKLRQSVAIFERKIESGEPWPGEQEGEGDAVVR